VPTSPAQATFDLRTAIVTATDSGIGRANAVALAEAGLDLGVTWHEDRDGAESTADEIRAVGRDVVIAHLDTSYLSTCGDVIDGLADQLGGVDVFVKNAGTGDKAPVLDMTLEQWRDDITANAVAPGEIATPMTGQTDTDPTRTVRPGIPLRRPGDAREIAAVIAFLASPQASYVTGASWAVDGGMLQMGPHAGSHLTDDALRQS
jgi:NAD(P)-dependent dehydrogenase (short-subunit alcohol dehydrogenase family)